MNQLTLDTRSLEAQAPTELLEAALAWISANPKAWEFIVSAAQRDALDIGRVRVKWYLEALRYGNVEWATESVKVPNALSAPFGRILVAWHPELKPFVPLAHSKTDGMSVPPRPY